MSRRAVTEIFYVLFLSLSLVIFSVLMYLFQGVSVQMETASVLADLQRVADYTSWAVTRAYSIAIKVPVDSDRPTLIYRMSLSYPRDASGHPFYICFENRTIGGRSAQYVVARATDRPSWEAIAPAFNVTAIVPGYVVRAEGTVYSTAAHPYLECYKWVEGSTTYVLISIKT